MNKINLLFIDQGLSFGGSFIVAARLASHLDPNQFNSYIMSSTTLDDIKHHASPHVGLIFLRKKLNYAHRALFNEAINKWCGSGRLGKLVKKCFIYAYSAVEYLANLAYSLHICLFIIKHKIHIVHGNNSVEAITCAKWLNKKILWHIHGDGKYTPREVANYYGAADYYLSISQFSTQNAINSGIDPTKITTLHNPTGEMPGFISLDKKNAIKQSLQIPEDGIVIGVFGRLVAWKGQLEFLHATKVLLDKGMNVFPLLVGSDGENFGGYTEQLKTFAQQMIGDDRVKFTGYVKNTDDYYQVCDLVVHSSIEPEPFGLVIIEAMKNGVAVIASNKGAGPELVSHGVNGLVADPSNTQELAAAMTELLENHTLRDSVVATAKKNVDEKMNPVYYAQEVEKIYKALMQGKPL